MKQVRGTHLTPFSQSNPKTQNQALLCLLAALLNKCCVELESGSCQQLLPPTQVIYYSEMHKIFGDLTQQLDQPGHSDEQRERENETKLSELRALSIVADD